MGGLCEAAIRRPALFGTPEQIAPPQVLIRANELANASGETFASAMHELRNNPDLLEAHLTNLSVKPRSRGQIDPDLAIARAKIEDAANFDDALGYLSRREIFAVLNSQAILKALFELPTTESHSRP